MFQTRRCFQLMGAGAVLSLVILFAREFKVTVRIQRYKYQQDDGHSRDQANSLNLRLPTNSSDSIVAEADSFYSTNATEDIGNVTKRESTEILNQNSPQLYRALKFVSQPVSFLPAAEAAAKAAAAGSTACQRPQPQNMVEYLTKRPDSVADAPAAGTVEGGFFAPRSCWPPVSRTAVIVPYRNRSSNLDIFIPYIHRLLSRQNILFGLFVVEQTDARLFNRAKLLNIGFNMSQRFYPFDCFVFHDSDKVPENVANVYDCVNTPKLLISEMRPQLKADYKKGKLYHNFFGGVTAVTKDMFVKANGYSNLYYGWGREDDELSSRLLIAGLGIKYAKGTDARYINLDHRDDIIPNKMPWPYVDKVRKTMQTDGLNSLKYDRLKIFLHPKFVLLRVDV